MEGNLKIIGGVIVSMIFALLVVTGLSYSMNRDEVGPCTISGKESVAVEGNNQYRVYSDECGAFVVNDTITAFRFDSADAYSALKIGETYNLRIQGFRLGIVSSFPNILEYEVVNQAN